MQGYDQPCEHCRLTPRILALVRSRDGYDFGPPVGVISNPFALRCCDRGQSAPLLTGKVIDIELWTISKGKLVKRGRYL